MKSPFLTLSIFAVLFGTSSSNGDLLDCACVAIYSYGDRVVALEDNPQDATNLPAGSFGTALCGTTFEDIDYIYVSWDKWNQGHNVDGLCQCGKGNDDNDHGHFWVQCHHIELVESSSCIGDFDNNAEVDVSDLLLVIQQWGACKDSCDADLTHDGVVSVNDLLILIGAWGPCNNNPTTGACLFIDATCTISIEKECVISGGIGWASDGSCSDTDNDRIPDVFEINDCSALSYGYVGTNPFDSDSDGDGLKDGDEVFGTTDGLALPLYGCNPCRKDLLVETDWIYATNSNADRNKLHINQVSRLIDAFANAPVVNIDGTTGVTLHIDYGQAPYFRGNSAEDPSGNSTINVNDWELDGSEYQTIKDVHFDSNRHGYFHYCLLADGYTVDNFNYYSSGVAELPGDDCIVSMGQWVTGDNDRIGNTFMHELGHNLDIRHGGFENRNWKPNYNSIMNYRFQFCGIDSDGDSFSDFVLDYSNGSNIDLDESSLDETVGVTGIGPAIDWNDNGNATETTVSQNINCSLDSWYCGPWDMTTNPCGSGTDCYDATCDVASDFNDWLNISFSGIADSDLFPSEIIHCIIE